MRILACCLLLGFCWMCGSWVGHKELCPWNGSNQNYFRENRGNAPYDRSGTGVVKEAPMKFAPAERYQHQTGK